MAAKQTRRRTPLFRVTLKPSRHGYHERRLTDRREAAGAEGGRQLHRLVRRRAQHKGTRRIITVPISGATSLVPHRGLRVSKRMLSKERPHLRIGVDAVARGPDEPFRQRLAAGPGVPSALNRV